MWAERRPRRSLRHFWIARLLLFSAALGPPLVLFLESFTPTHALGRLLRELYGWQCHQRLARTISVGAIAFPVCARCLGIYFGLGLAALVDRPRLRPNARKAWLLVAGLLLLVDVATEGVGLRPASAGFRAATGAFMSFGIGLAILDALRPRRRSG